MNVHASTFIIHCVRLHSAAYLHESAVRAPRSGKQERAIQSWAAALRRAHAMGSASKFLLGAGGLGQAILHRLGRAGCPPGVWCVPTDALRNRVT